MEWKIIVIIILVCQFPVSVLSLLRLFKQNYKTKKMIAWNVTIMALPIVGAIIFWSFIGIKSAIERKNNHEKDNS